MHLKPQLLITTSTLPNDEHDPEPRFVIDLAIGLSRYFEVCVLAPRNLGAPAVAAFADVEVRRYAYAPRAWEQLTYPGATRERLRQKPIRWGLVPLLMAGLYRETRRLLATRDFACTHAHWLVPQAAIQSVVRSGRSQAPYIAITHGGDVYGVNDLVGSAMLRRSIQHACGVVGVSQALIETLHRRFSSAMTNRPSAVIGMGVDTAKFSPTLRSDDWATVHGLSRPVIAYVGRLAEKKGIEFLIAAMALEPLRSLRASLAIIGRGVLEERLKTLCKSLGLGHRIQFIQPCSHAILGRHIASTDIFCVPSVTTRNGDQDGRPTVLVEAGACGVPTVASDIAGIREWIKDGYDGVLVPPADPFALAKALASVLARPQRIKWMGHAARQKAIQSSWSIVADRYAEFTFELLGRSKVQSGRRIVG